MTIWKRNTLIEWKKDAFPRYWAGFWVSSIWECLVFMYFTSCTVKLPVVEDAITFLFTLTKAKVITAEADCKKQELYNVCSVCNWIIHEFLVQYLSTNMYILCRVFKASAPHKSTVTSIKYFHQIYGRRSLMGTTYTSDYISRNAGFQEMFPGLHLAPHAGQSDTP